MTAPLAAAAAQARRIAVWATVAIGFSIPLSTALDSLLVAVLVVCWIASGRYAEKMEALRAYPFAVLAIGFFLLHVVGASYSIGQAGDVLRALDKSAVILLIPLLISLRPGPEICNRALHAFMAAMLLTLVLSFLLWIGVVPEGGEHDIIKGMQHDPTVFKKHITHSVLMTFAALAFAIKARDAARAGMKFILALISCLMAFNVLFMVHGRTGQLALAVLLLYFLIVRFRWRGVAVAGAAAALLAGVIAVVPSSALHQRMNATIAEIEDWRAGKPVRPENRRLETWDNSLTLIRERPLFGYGTGGFVSAYAKQVEGTAMEPAGHAENQYLYTAMQLGVVGLAVLLGLLAYQWHLAARLPVRSDTDLARGLVIVMAIGFLFNPFLHDHTEALFYAWLSGLLYAGLRPPAARGSLP